MGPLRVAIIGLSSNAKTSWAAEAHLPYLISSRGKLHYELVALLNSSISAAEAAKTHFNLSPNVKAYGDPDLLAADPNIDLVVCCTRVDTHFPTTLPSLRAGKAIFVEWPIAESLERAVELTGNGRFDNSMVGLQTRFSPFLLKVKEVLTSGKIGKILSSQVNASPTVLPRGALPESLGYFADRVIGGNPMTIGYAHMIDYVHEVLGEFESFESRIQIQRPTISILGTDNSKIRDMHSDVPDFLAVHGKLMKGKANIADDVTLAVTFKSNPPFKGTPGFEWTIHGEKGELRITSPLGSYLQLDIYAGPVTIQLHDFESDEVVDVEWDWQDWQKELPVPARMIGEVYEQYASWFEGGKAGEVGWPTIHGAMVRMEEVDMLFKQYDTQS